MIMESSLHTDNKLIKNIQNIFIAYSHIDKKFLDEFRTTLRPIVRKSHPIVLWDDSKINPGQKWVDEIINVINSTKIAILLVSQNFLASDFIDKIELPSILKNAEEKGLIVFWICLYDCLYESTEIVDFQAAHDIKIPLSSLNKSKRQKVWSEICRRLINLMAILNLK